LSRNGSFCAGIMIDAYLTLIFHLIHEKFVLRSERLADAGVNPDQLSFIRTQWFESVLADDNPGISS